MDTATRRTPLRPLTPEEYLEAARGDPYYLGRWPYYRVVLGLVEEMMPLETALELGARGLPILHGADTMDIESDLADLTFRHDATETPWPVADGAYDLFVALQVWEHLGGKQRLAFLEAMRVARRAILSFPYRWHCPEDPEHHGITEATIGEWTLGTAPSRALLVGKRLVCLYDFRPE